MIQSLLAATTGFPSCAHCTGDSGEFAMIDRSEFSGISKIDFWTTKALPALYFWSHDRRCLCSRSRVVYWSRSGIRDCLCLHSGLFVVILVPLRRDEVSFECKKILKIESAFPLCHHICNYKADGNGKMSPGPRAAWCSRVLVLVTQHK